MSGSDENVISANDRILERALTNTYDAVVATTGLADQLGHPRALTTGVTRLAFTVDPYISHFEVSIMVPEDGDDELHRTSYVRFNASACREYRFYTISEDRYKSVAPVNEKVPDASCYELMIRYNDKLLCAENVFTDLCPSYVTDLRDHLRCCPTISIFVRGRAKIAADFNNLSRVLQSDSTRNPLLQWYPPNTRRPLMQKGMVLEQEDRPAMAVEPVLTCFSWLDYMTRYGYGHLYNHEYLESITDPFAIGVHSMRFFEVPGAGDRRLMFFLEMPPTEEVRLLPGDKLEVSFDEERDITMTWSATIIERLPYSPISTVTGYVTRPWNQKIADYSDTRVIPAISWQRLDRTDKATALIMRQQPVQVGLRLVSSDKPFSRSLSALEGLNRIYNDMSMGNSHQMETLKVLIGNHFDIARKYDVYKSVRATMPHPEESMSLNDGQRKAILMLKSLPAGWCVIQGPPGTGKTYLACEAVKPFFLDAKKHHILFCSANNAGVDNMARRAQEVLAGLQKEQKVASDKYIIRLHTLETEKSIATNDARLQAGIPENARPPCVEDFDAEELELLDRLEMAQVVNNAYKQHTKQKFPGIHDKRVTDLQYSLGYRMLQVSGIIPDAPFALSPTDPIVSGFNESWCELSTGEKMNKDRSQNFRAQIKSLAGYTIQHAELICCTPAVAAIPQVAENYVAAEGMIMDESACLLESDLWPIIYNYMGLVWKVLIGDTYQLGPVVRSKKEYNPFAPQMMLSLQYRLQMIGASSAFLDEQLRAVEQIARPYNRVTYSDRLTHAPSTRLVCRPIAQAVRAFNKDCFALDSNVVYIDIAQSRSKELGTKSVYNDGSCMYALNLLEKLLTAGIKGTIGLLTPYQAQYRCLALGVQNMSNAFPGLTDRVEVDKIDRRQGSEWDITICDITRTRDTGFLRYLGRLNTFFSRAKNGLYIIGSKAHIDKLKRSNGKWLQRFQSQYLKLRFPDSIPADCKWYQPGQVDLRDAYDLEEDNAPNDLEKGRDNDIAGSAQDSGWENTTDYTPAAGGASGW